ncbi:VOC family protein [Longivirga aurantiaca]|uniref:VOC family protein n=1 Tax=Longivirga aurantiaca TaxID=1837743 RepID=A0ABW1T3Z9_9ACTN
MAARTPSPSPSLDLVTLLVDDYDRAIAWFTDVLGFELAEDSPSLTNDGRPKRWVVVRPSPEATGFLLAVADTEQKRTALGNQTGGRVGFFLRVPAFEASLARLRAAGTPVLGEPRREEYGQVVVVVDPFGNRWDLVGPRSNR